MYLFAILGIISVIIAFATNPPLGFLDSSPLLWVGGISYGIYVFHIPVLHMDFGLPLAVGIILKAGIIVFAAWLAEALLQPLLNKRTKAFVRSLD